MGLYNFQPRFVEPILAGTKTHTIRAFRERNERPGDMMHLYTGLRHKGARLLMRRKCVSIECIHINANQQVFVTPWGGPGERVSLDRSEKEQLARRDGFGSFAEMLKYWDGNLPFTGLILHWDGTKTLSSDERASVEGVGKKS